MVMRLFWTPSNLIYQFGSIRALVENNEVLLLFWEEKTWASLLDTEIGVQRCPRPALLFEATI